MRVPRGVDFMNIEAYNLDSLRKLVRDLQDENKRLKEQLEKANIPYDTENVFGDKIENMEEYDPDQGGRISPKYITKDLANRYFSMFWGRTAEYCLWKSGILPKVYWQYGGKWNSGSCKRRGGRAFCCSG